MNLTLGVGRCQAIYIPFLAVIVKRTSVKTEVDNVGFGIYASHCTIHCSTDLSENFRQYN